VDNQILSILKDVLGGRRMAWRCCMSARCLCVELPPTRLHPVAAGECACTHTCNARARVCAGLEQCGKGAARCRLLAAIAAMRSHGSASVAPTVVSALLSYAHSQHAPAHVGELCRLADQATAEVVQKLVERLMASLAIMTGDEDRGLAASERVLVEQLLGPVFFL
jgi:hypothetical protein